MSQSVQEKDMLTSTGLLVSYYAMGLLTLVVGITIFIPLIGSFLSGRAAKKTGNVFVERHCAWLFNSTFISLALIMLMIGSGTIAFGLSESDITYVNNYIKDLSFEQVWADPALQSLVKYIAGIFIATVLISIWFIYRIVRGGIMLLRGRPPKGA